MQISRRDALMGATAAAVVTGVTTAPLAIKTAGVKAALDGDPVIGLSEQLRAANEAWFSAIDAYEEAYHRVGYNWVYYRGSVEVETSDGRASWDADEVRAAVEDGRNYYRLTLDQRDTALAEIEQRLREGQELRQELGIEPLYQEVEHLKARFWDLQARLLDMPAATPRGIFAKLRGFYHDDEIAAIRAGDDFGDGLPPEWATSIYRDLERLAREARS